MFNKAKRTQLKLRVALCGPTGSGKTYTALQLAAGMGGRVAVIDTESGSASRYADKFDFDVCELANHSPQEYMAAIRDAEAAGFDVLIIDSLSHAWMGKNGALEQVDKAGARSQGNKFAGWKEVTPIQTALIELIVRSKCHVIATMRSKMQYELQENEKGKKVPVKLGMGVIQRDGVEYEFDIVAEMDQDHRAIFTKSRMAEIADEVISKPGKDIGKRLKEWADGGEPVPPSVQPPPPTQEMLDSTAALVAQSGGDPSKILAYYKIDVWGDLNADQLNAIRKQAMGRIEAKARS